MGITDIDDKIIKRSIESGEDFKALSKRFETEFLDDMNKLNVREPYFYCRVTDYVPQIICFIEKLIASGYGYITKDGTIFINILIFCCYENIIRLSFDFHLQFCNFAGSVYFDTNKYDRYGKLSTPFPDAIHTDKRSALDFALWKAAKDKEPSWECPWGHGRPGWHIECSAIAR